ncbi:MAG: hypothetical protein KME31_18055 [Tolypothrix carrinoi HA7290-LM1]|nr:hypothetical protein [Tolypothrix carrinoi HA7290-LM1]
MRSQRQLKISFSHFGSVAAQTVDDATFSHLAIVFAVNTRAMYQAGYEFYCSDNNVWLVDNVPPLYLQNIKILYFY